MKKFLIILLLLFSTNLFATIHFKTFDLTPKLDFGISKLGIQSELSFEIDKNIDVCLKINSLFFSDQLNKSINIGYKFLTQSFYGLSSPFTLFVGIQELSIPVHEEKEGGTPISFGPDSYDLLLALNTSASLEPRIVFFDRFGIFSKIEAGILTTILPSKENNFGDIFPYFSISVGFLL